MSKRKVSAKKIGDILSNRLTRKIPFVSYGTGEGIEWVIPTGGEYFFSPSIKALRDNLSDA